ncbi:tellurite resistance domain protein [Pectobacterium colocasium]|uniref:tellurite resistance domain protein n=1 Tax=Pectobacterium colocasium TaxID=2878098 RepID=UPI001CD76A93|nr:tellurite resistance domain protein [Pectobacterium colocasium]
MQRLTSAAVIDDSTLATYEKTVAIIRRYLPSSLALLYASVRRSPEGNLEWWTERQGLARPFSALSDAEQLSVQSKRQKYQEIVTGLIEQLITRGDHQSAQALQQLLTHSQGLACYDVGGEPVLTNWAIPVAFAVEPTPVIASIPWWRRLLPWLLLLLLLLLLALAYWWCRGNTHTDATAQVPNAEPTPVVATQPAAESVPASTNLTEDNPSINLTKQRDFGQIKVNLTWQQGKYQRPVDLDIAAFVRLKNGELGGVEALSTLFGNYEKSPYAILQKDLRDGANQDGEWIFINGSHWQEIDEVLIYSFIYGGADNWQGTDATITLYVPGQPPISTTLTDGRDSNNVAAIARLKNIDGDINVERLNSFFRNRESMDKHYGWGFKWTPVADKK